MSRSKHQSHPISRGKTARNPRFDRKRKHKPYGLHKSSFTYLEIFRKRGWGLDSQEKWECTNISSKAKGRREGKDEIKRQLNEL